MNATKSTVKVSAPRATAGSILACLGRWAAQADVHVITQTRWLPDGGTWAQVDMYTMGTPVAPTPPANDDAEDPKIARPRGEATRLHVRLAAADHALELARANATPGSVLWAAIRAYDIACDDHDTPTAETRGVDQDGGRQ